MRAATYLGHVPAAAREAPASAAAASERLWRDVRALDWAFTSGTTLVMTAAAWAAWARSVEAATGLGTPPPCCWRAQVARGVVVLTGEAEAVPLRADAPPGFALFKAALPLQRLLLVVPGEAVCGGVGRPRCAANAVVATADLAASDDAAISLGSLGVAGVPETAVEMGGPAASEVAVVALQAVVQSLRRRAGATDTVVRVVMADVRALVVGVAVAATTPDAAIAAAVAVSDDDAAAAIDPAVIAQYTMAAAPASAPPPAIAGVKRARQEGGGDVAAGAGGAGAEASSAAPPPAKSARMGEASARAAGGAGADAGAASAPAIAPPSIRLAIIVPYRDQPLQNRAAQLERFAAYMPAFLGAGTPALAGFHIIVVEQTDDGYKFNRGKCLNAGFDMATAPDRAARLGLPSAAFDAFCFHDVDLLPQAPLRPFYTMPATAPVHIGAAWTRYNYADYVGGIITMDEPTFRRLNGFPNNMWGWGGEDDVLARRMHTHHVYNAMVKPPASATGAVVDLEEELKRERGTGERAGTSLKAGGRSEWRCMWKAELIGYHVTTKNRDGLSTLRYDVVGVRHLNAHTTVVTVDLRAAEDPAAERAEHVDPTLKVSKATVEAFLARMLEAEAARGGSAAPAPASAGAGSGGS